MARTVADVALLDAVITDDAREIGTADLGVCVSAYRAETSIR